MADTWDLGDLAQTGYDRFFRRHINPYGNVTWIDYKNNLAGRGQSILSGAGYSVKTFDGFQKAWPYVAANKQDLIILELNIVDLQWQMNHPTGAFSEFIPSLSFINHLRDSDAASKRSPLFVYATISSMTDTIREHYRHQISNFALKNEVPPEQFANNAIVYLHNRYI